jgi:hypothetical protein
LQDSFLHPFSAKPNPYLVVTRPASPRFYRGRDHLWKISVFS